MDAISQAAIAEVVKLCAAPTTSKVSQHLKDYWAQNHERFSAYVSASTKKHAYTKTLLNKDQSISITDIYVGTRLQGPQDDKPINERVAVRRILGGSNVVVEASAGAGKSFFSKYLYLSALEQKRTVPILIELRHLNDSERGILEQLRFEMRAHGFDLGNDLTVQMIKSGRFVLILDGYDELSTGIVRKINSEIQDLRSLLAGVPFLITTRPGTNIDFIPEFDRYTVRELSRHQAISLIEKIKYDGKVKTKFLKQLRDGLFAKHRDFLSNPLLLTIMLLTYRELAEIPTKMHIFYEHAFDALYYRHDASKGMFRREILCDLAIDDFKEILANISASAYIRGKLTLSNTDLLTFIRKAKKNSNIKLRSPEKYKQDLVRSVCVLINDGQHFSYNHRSFQEYFAALYLTQYARDHKEELYDRYLDRSFTDSALNLALEMSRGSLEDEFIMPRVRRLLDGVRETKDILPKWFSGLQLSWVGSRKSGFPTYDVSAATSDWRLTLFLERAYAPLINERVAIRHILTKKAFLAEFGCSSTPTVIRTRYISPSDLRRLENIGVIESASRRLQYLRTVLERLESRELTAGQSKLEDQL